MKDKSEWLTIQEAAELSGYVREYLRDLANEGKIQARKVATVWLINRRSLLDWVRHSAELGERRGAKRKRKS